MPAHHLPISEQNANRIDHLVRAGLDVLEQQEAQDHAKLETLRAAAIGLGDLSAGRCETVEADDIEAFFAALREPQGKP